MSWKIDIKPTAEKYYLKLAKNSRNRVKKALLELQNSEDPFSEPNVSPLSGTLRGDYRMRVGKWRILFTPDRENRIIHIYAILPRGDAH